MCGTEVVRCSDIAGMRCDDGSAPSRQEIQAGAGDGVLSDGAADNAAQRDSGNGGSGADKQGSMVLFSVLIISTLHCR